MGKRREEVEDAAFKGFERLFYVFQLFACLDWLKGLIEGIKKLHEARAEVFCFSRVESQ